MAQPAPLLDRDLTAADDARWNLGAVHGHVAEMHRTIEAKLRLDASTLVIAPVAPGAVDHALRLASRGLGWAALAAAAIAVARLLLA